MDPRDRVSSPSQRVWTIVGWAWAILCLILAMLAWYTPDNMAIDGAMRNRELPTAHPASR
jgi:hypothetical protein